MAIKNAVSSDFFIYKITRNSVSIAICCQAGDKLQSKTLFLAIFYLCSSIVKSVFN